MGSSMLVINGLVDPTSVEAIACQEALALAVDLAIQDLHIASDCKPVIKDIHDRSNAAHGVVIKEIRDWMNSFISCTFTFECRNGNFDGHKLARHSLCLDQGRHTWLGHPHDQSIIHKTLPIE